MLRHPYLRAYMVGVLLPSWFLLVALGLYLLGHISGRIPGGLERGIIFPMAVVPNLWGLWNVIYILFQLRRYLSLGAFGAILPVLLVPAGIALASALDLRFYPAAGAAAAMPVLIGVYYLAWKYGVSFLNRIVELR